MNHPDWQWLPGDLWDQVGDQLRKPMPRGRGELVFRDRPRHLGEREVDGKRHVVFVSYYAYLSTIKKSICLRNTGRYHTTLLACCIREDVEPGRWFDEFYELEHYAELFDLLHEARPQALSVHIPLPILAAAAFGAGADTRLVLDVNDATLFMDHTADSFACRLEERLLHRCDAFIHKMPPQAVEELRSATGTNAPDYLAHSLPCREFFVPDGGQLRPRPSLVYAGGIVPYAVARQQGHGGHIFDPFIEAVSVQGFGFTVFVNQNARDMHWDEQAHYFALQGHYPGFRMQPGLPGHRLPAALSGASCGVLYDNLAASSYRREHYTHNMSTKIFSYLESGLPILVYEELAYIADLVREHGIGLVYDQGRLDRLGSLLDGADFANLRANVSRYRAANELETVLPVLEQAYACAEEAACN